MDKEYIFLSVVIPQYNEQANLEREVLSQVYQFLSTQSFPYEVIIVDDGSLDKGKELAKTFCKEHSNFRLIEAQHGGKAVALFNGIKECRGEFILMTDMDQSTPIQELNKLIPSFKEGYDIIIGSRGTRRNNSGKLRKAASYIFGKVRKFLILRNIVDTQCGFKAFRNIPQIHNIFSKLDALKDTKNIIGWTVTAFDVEFLFMSQKAGLKIKEVEVDWKNEDTSNTKDRKFFRESIDMLKQIFTIHLNDLKRKYKDIK